MNGLPGAESRYKTICSQLYRSLESKMIMKRENDTRTRFATKHVAPDVFRDESLRDFYRCLSSSKVGDDDTLGIEEDEFVRRVIGRELQPFVATLVFIGAAIMAVRAFVTNVVAEPDDLGNKLPLTQARLEEIFLGDPATVHNFLSNQHRFCTLTLFSDTAHMVLDDDDTIRLPYIRERKIARGGYGSVWEIEIPHGHLVIHTHRETSLPGGPKVVARKDYHRPDSSRQDFENERDLCKAIISSPNRCDNILLSYGTIEYSSGSAFSLFMPKAEFDLHEYMEYHEGDNTHSVENVAKHILCAAGLARGVAHLHNGIESPGGGTLVCYHMDLKPDNILIFYTGREMIWKISDFGLSRIKTLPDGSIRSTSHHLTISPTRNLAGQGIYLAPESASPRRMTRKSDVWSLGCIVSVLCVWLQGGYNGVREYSTSRIEAGDNSASFYIPRIFGYVKLNPQVKEQHRVLIRNEEDAGIKGMLIDILRYLEKNTFSIKASERPEASELKRRLENAAAKGLKAAERATHAPTSVNPVIRTLKSITSPRSSVSSVKGWPISFPIQGQACRFSPDGAILSYYSSERNQIALYYGSDQFPTNPGDRLIEPAPIYTHSTDIMDVGLTRNYMLIAEKANNFRFSLVSFIDARSNGPCFDHQTLISAKIPSIHLIAISPQGHWIACIVKGNVTNSVPGRLYLAERKNVISAQKENGELNKRVWRYRDLPRWTNQDANNIMSLSFSSESSIWFVVKPAPGCNACVARLPYTMGDNEPLKTFESASFKGPCIIVTTGNVLVIHDFDHLSLPGIEKRIDERFKVIQMVMSRDDHRILALVKPNNEYGELRLVELSIERNHTKVGMLEIERFNVQYLEYSLRKVQLKWVEGTGTQNRTSRGSRALIAVLAKQHENAIFEVNVPPRSPNN
ncbi:hypothetical protein F5Y10DRAFT_278797 [Nemania abortiva]|nr:hypothetical protein F5Y10DRAFT_278797 [Nemania abortiva]